MSDKLIRVSLETHKMLEDAREYIERLLEDKDPSMYMSLCKNRSGYKLSFDDIIWSLTKSVVDERDATNRELKLAMGIMRHVRQSRVTNE